MAAVVAVLMAACGDSGNDERGELTIAMILPKTGTFSTQYQPFVGAVALAGKIINDAGGILGNNVVFDERDEAAGTNGTQPITDVANDLVALGIQVWVGPQLSDSAITAGAIAGANKRLLIAPNAGATAFSTIADDDYAFRGNQPARVTGIGAAQAVYDAGHRTVSVLHLNNAVSTDLGNVFADTFSALGGTVLVNHGYVFDTANPSAFDPQAQLDVVFAGNPDALFLYGATVDATALLSAWDKADWNGQMVLGAALASSDIAPAVGVAKMAGALVYTTAPADPADQALVSSAFEELNGFAMDDTNVALVNSLLQSTLLAALALEEAGENDGTKARDALRKIANAPGEQVKGAVDFKTAMDVIRRGDDLDFVGLQAPLEFDAYGDFPGNVSERRFNTSGGIDVVRVLVPGADF